MNIYEFIANYGIIGLSISTALGLAFYEIIKNISGEIVIPFIGILLGIRKFSELHVIFKGQNINIGIILKGIITYIFTLLFIVGIGYYIFGNLLKHIHEKKVSIDRQTLEEQKRTSDLLSQLINKENNEINSGNDFINFGY